jgi:hypothetical protein
MEYIKSFKSKANENGYNLSDGGEGGTGFKASPEQKLKMSQSFMGHTNTPPKLNEQQVFEIRKIYLEQKISFQEFNKILPITQENKKNKPRLSKAFVNEERAREIKNKYIPYKYTAKMLAKEYNLSERLIRMIVEASDYYNYLK